MPKKKSIRIVRKILLGAIPFLALLVFWYFFHYFSGNLSWLVPSPYETGLSFLRLLRDGTLLGLLGISLVNLMPPFIAATISAIAMGILMGINRTIYKIFYPFLAAIYPVPSLVWLPFVILFLGFTRETIWFVIFVSSFTKIIYNIIGGVQNINIDYILVAKNFGFSKPKIVFHVILPYILPQILTGLRVGFGSAWRSLIGAEMLVVTLGGLGKFIWISQWYFNFDHVIAGIFVISLVSILIEKVIFRRLETHTLAKWGSIREEYSF